MSKNSRVWLVQVADKEPYLTVTDKFYNALRKAKYFNTMYLGLDAINECWSNNIIEGLKHVEEDVLFMGCEDHILVDFDEHLVNHAYDGIVKGVYDCIRLTKKPQIKIDPCCHICPMPEDYPYYISLQPSIWSKKALESILVPDESAWDFEINGSKRAKEKGLRAGVTHKTAFNYENWIVKGKLVENPKDYVSIHGT